MEPKCLLLLAKYPAFITPIPFTTIVTLFDVVASSKPVTDTVQLYHPASSFSNGENVTVLVNNDMLLDNSDTLTLGDSDNELPPVQLTIIRCDETPTIAITEQVRVLSNPLTDPSIDCEIFINGCGTECSIYTVLV